MEQLDKFMVAAAINDVIDMRDDTTCEIFAAHDLEIAGVGDLTPPLVQSPDAGFVLFLANGAEYRVTIVRSR